MTVENWHPNRYGRQGSISIYIRATNPKPGYNGKLVCIRDNGDGQFTKGKVYEAVDGYIHNDFGFVFSVPICSLNEFNYEFADQYIFIELVE